MAKTKKNKNTDKIESQVDPISEKIDQVQDAVLESVLEVEPAYTETKEIEDDYIEKSKQIIQESIIEECKVLAENSIDLLSGEELKALNKGSFEKRLSDEIKKQAPGLYAQLVVVARGMEYILIKAKNNIYCYARFVKSQRVTESSPEWELEFLANIPAAMHKDILSITHACGTHDSRRVFFNPSGMM
jgi:hypothetical protein